jgi:hypothetical protein
VQPRDVVLVSGVRSKSEFPLFETFRTRYPGSGVTFGEVNGADPFNALRSGEHDVNVLWLPVLEPLGELAARYNTPPGIAFLPMPDAPELQWALTWRSTNDNAAIRALARTAADFGPIQL